MNRNTGRGNWNKAIALNSGKASRNERRSKQCNNKIIKKNSKTTKETWPGRCCNELLNSESNIQEIVKNTI